LFFEIDTKFYLNATAKTMCSKNNKFKDAAAGRTADEQTNWYKELLRLKAENEESMLETSTWEHKNAQFYNNHRLEDLNSKIDYRNKEDNIELDIKLKKIESMQVAHIKQTEQIQREILRINQRIDDLAQQINKKD
jgi:hypothetical protein